MPRPGSCWTASRTLASSACSAFPSWIQRSTRRTWLFAAATCRDAPLSARSPESAYRLRLEELAGDFAGRYLFLLGEATDGRSSPYGLSVEVEPQ